MIYRLDSQQCGNLEVSARREWLLTNGIGGYAMGTPSGINTRRYHGLLVAAEKPPSDRVMLLASLDVFMQGNGNPIGLSTNQYPGAVYPEGYLYMKSFSVGKVAIWEYEAEKLNVRKRLFLHPGENAITMDFENTGERPLLLTLRPLVCRKPHHENFVESPSFPDDLQFHRGSTSILDKGVTLTISHPGAQRVPVQGWYYRFEHTSEVDRGLDPRDDLFCPFELRYELRAGEVAILAASDRNEVQPITIPTEDVSNTIRIQPMLEDAVKKFIVKTESRTSIIAGYPWFTDWG
ncbi:MAG: glycogen debranching enzyme family protein, partial [Chlorobia bacterium]|nr:glycogen debranching enzyme family protein [Fimbriimonadaceae bacterium]